MSEKLNNPSAFPTGALFNKDGLMLAGQDGMTLRDYFAAQTIAVAYKFWIEDFYHNDRVDADIRNDSPRDDIGDNYELIADTCYEMADAMLEARKNG
jgi:hypothetical protein